MPAGIPFSPFDSPFIERGVGFADGVLFPSHRGVPRRGGVLFPSHRGVPAVGWRGVLITTPPRFARHPFKEGELQTG
ncbi:MAG: hypothetical protein ACPLPS_07070 [bacterium]